MKYTPLVALVAFSFGCSSSEAQKKTTAASVAAAPPLEVAVASVQVRPVDRAIDLTGSLHPDESVNVSFEVPGTLSKVYFDFGQTVRAGQVIAELDKSELNLQLDRSRAALTQSLARIGLSPGQETSNPDSTPAIRQALAQLEDAKSKYESADRLLASGDISRERHTELEKAYRAREAAVQATRDDLRMQLAAVQGLRADLRLAQKRVADATMKAPFDGAINARLASPGQYLKENTPVVTLVKSSPLRLRTDIPESDVGEIRIGGTLTFTTEAVPGKTFRATIRELNPSLDSRSRSLTAEARIVDGDSRLKPGMFVQTRLSAGKVETTFVPDDAVYSVAGLTKVYAIRQGAAVECKVQAGSSVDGWIPVKSDTLKAGDKVAISNTAALANGVKVSVKQSAAGETAGI